MDENLDIITLGESLVEFSSLTSLKNTAAFDKYYGGDTLVTAVAALRSGSKVGYITKVGNDSFGEFMLDAWRSEGLDASQVRLSKGQNGVYFVGIKDNMREYQYYRKKTAASTICIDDIDFDYIKKASLVYVTGFVQSLSLSANEVIQEVFKFARANNIITAYDPNCQKYNMDKEEAIENFNKISEFTDIILIESGDGKELFGIGSPTQIITRLSDLAIKTIVVKDLETGIHVYDSNDTINILPLDSKDVEGLDDKITDATGVSNAFNGAFLSKILSGNSAHVAAKYANVLSLLQMQGVGAIKSIPQNEKVEEFYRKIYE